MHCQQILSSHIVAPAEQASMRCHMSLKVACTGEKGDLVDIASAHQSWGWLGRIPCLCLFAHALLCVHCRFHACVCLLTHCCVCIAVQVRRVCATFWCHGIDVSMDRWQRQAMFLAACRPQRIEAWYHISVCKVHCHGCRVSAAGVSF